VPYNHVIISGTALDRMITRFERRLTMGSFEAHVAQLAAMGRQETESGGDAEF
jgi:hypothetical protein